MNNPLDIDDERLVYDIKRMEAIWYKGNGVIQILHMVVIEDFGDDTLAYCDGTQIFVTREYVDAIKDTNKRYMTLKGI